MPGGPFAERQQVQRAGVAGCDGEADEREREHAEDLAPGGLGERAELPEGDLADRGGVGGEQEQADQGAAEGVHRDAGEDQGDHFGAAAGAGHRVHREDRQQAGDEGGGGDRPGAERVQAEHDAADGADRAAGGDADDGRFGERVAEHALHQGARAAERAADQQGQHDPGQPDVPEHRLGDAVEFVAAEAEPVAEGGEDVAERDPVGADAGREHGADHQGDGEAGGEQGGPAGPSHGRGGAAAGRGGGHLAALG